LEVIVRRSPGESSPPTGHAPLEPAPRRAGALRWLALGASIGGPAALRDLLAALPSPLPLRVVVVQHIAYGLERTLAEWLAGELGLDVRTAVDGELPVDGAVRFAPAGAHLRVRPGGRLELDGVMPPRGGHRPSIDELFLSLAAVFPRATAAALLSGSGEDGAQGLLALRRAGAFCLVQDAASSAASGMPSAALALGAAEAALSPRGIGSEVGLRSGPV
jgi:two-component system chemotaxis response regulator CheB